MTRQTQWRRSLMRSTAFEKNYLTFNEFWRNWKASSLSGPMGAGLKGLTRKHLDSVLIEQLGACCRHGAYRCLRKISKIRLKNWTSVIPMVT